MLGSIDHVGIAVKNIAEARHLYEGTFGLPQIATEEVAGEQVRLAFFRTAGDTAIELIEPVNQEGSLAKFLAERGPGLHHLAFRVENLEAAILQAQAKGLEVLGQPRPGGQGKRIIFCHPRTTGGVLIEFCQRAEPGE